MGLHEEASGFSGEEQALRNRLWLSVHTMDVYASTALGLPSSFSPADLHVQRERKQDVLPDAGEMTPMESAPSAYQHLARVVHSCLDRVYRDRDFKTASVGPQVISSKSLREASAELETWGHSCASIADQLHCLGLLVKEEQSSGEIPDPFLQLTTCTRTQLLLCYAYCQAQLLLYTPLVHHLVQMDLKRDSEGYLFGTKCVRAALAAVNVAGELKRRFQLNEAYFQTVDTLVNSAMVLLAVELGSADANLLRAAIPAGRRAKDILLALAPLSIKASECWQALQPLYRNGKCEPAKPKIQHKKVAEVLENLSYDTHSMDIDGVNPVHVWFE